MKFVAENIDQLQLPAQHLAKMLRQTHMAVFSGEMGAGKTTFIKTLCKELGIKEEASSPTFSLVNEYRTTDGTPVYHFDFYRIETEDEAENIGIYEYFDGGICLIEWGEKIPNILKDETHIQIQIEVSENKRIITFDTKG